MIRVRTVMTGVGGAPYYTSHYFDDVESSTDAQTAVDSVSSFWNSLRSMMVAPLAITVEGFVQSLDPVTGNLTGAFSVTQNTLLGSSNGQPLPPATQALIQLRTPGIVAGKLLRGRIFLPAISEDLSQTGVPISEVNDRVQTAAGYLVNSDAPWVVWSRTGGVTSPVTSVTTWNKWAVLRSRRD